MRQLAPSLKVDESGSKLPHSKKPIGGGNGRSFGASLELSPNPASGEMCFVMTQIASPVRWLLLENL